MPFTAEWRNANGALLATFTPLPTTPAHKLKKWHKRWKQRQWTQHRTRTSRRRLNRVNELRAEGQRIAQQRMPPLQDVKNHLADCWPYYGHNDEHSLIDNVLAPLYYTTTPMCGQDKLLYYGRKTSMEKFINVFAKPHGTTFALPTPIQTQLNTHNKNQLKTFWAEKKSRPPPMYMDPHSPPPHAARPFIHFILLIAERIAKIPPEIWLLITSCSSVDQLAFRFVPRIHAPCEQCGKAALWRCQRCKSARYCNTACQTANYTAHKHTCRRPYSPA